MHGSHNKSMLVSRTTTSDCTDQISQMILQDNYVISAGKNC